MDNQLLLAGTIIILLLALSFLTSITYEVMLLINRRNSLMKKFLIYIATFKMVCSLLAN